MSVSIAKAPQFHSDARGRTAAVLNHPDLPPGREILVHDLDSHRLAGVRLHNGGRAAEAAVE